ncbi:MAG: hypothetical protein K6G84_05980, partial [Lachnospiraceae bacterium]|nr:hypothetical protein [Lachnospiraceae bacterium]
AIIVPYMAHDLRRINYENMGEIDAEQFSEDMNEILDLATKALLQEPCEDCISRQAVIDAMNNNRFRYTVAKEDGCTGNVLWDSDLIDSNAMRDISNLPSVNPQESKTAIALDRYKDLEDYFEDADMAKTVLENQKEFKAWLERLRWNTKKVDDLARKLEALEQEPKTVESLEKIISDAKQRLSEIKSELYKCSEEICGVQMISTEQAERIVKNIFEQEVEE